MGNAEYMGSLEMSDSSSTSSSCSTSSGESDEDDFRQMTVMAAEPRKEFDAKDDSANPQPDHNKLGADLSLMSFLKQGPIRRGVVNAVNPMMPISTSEIFNPMQIVTASSFQVGNYGFIPQDRPQTYTQEQAARQCKINFGPEFVLATFDNDAEVDSVVAIMNNNGVNTHAYWTGHTDLCLSGFGQLNQAFEGDFPWMENEPTDNGNGQPCIRINNGEFNDVACDKRHSGTAKQLTGMGVICKSSGVDYVNTDKKNKMFYCDLEQIGLVELIKGKFKEGKSSLSDCKKKRAAAPKAMLKMGAGRLELDCTDCKKDNVVWSKVECQVSCKADKSGNKLSAGFGCEPVFDENNAVIGSRYIFADGFKRFQEICGGGCTEQELHEYLGPAVSSVYAKKCSVRDVHHPGSFTSKQYCQFSCPSHHDKNIELTTTNSLYCKCETMDVSTDGVSKRECNWRIKKGGYPALDAKKKGEFIEPLLFGVGGVDQCKDAFYLTTTSTTTSTPTSNSLAAMLFINTKYLSHTPHLIDATGELSTSFDTNGQDVFQSCGVTFQNKQLIFGGNTHRRQILQVDSCSLTSVGSIPFDHYRAACGSTAGVIVLCFNYDEFATGPDGLRRRRDGSDANDAKRCRQATSPSGPWTEMALSTYEHKYTSIAASPDEF